MTMSKLISSVCHNDLDALRSLLEAGGDPDARDADGRTSLMHAVLCDHLAALTLLLDNGADPNLKDSRQEWTALHFAAQERRADMVPSLIDSGANVDEPDAFGNTALFRAVFASQGDNQAVVALLAAGADPNKANNHGVSPRSLATTIDNYDVSTVFE